MGNISTESYREWTISVFKKDRLCSRFAFDICDPSGQKQHVSMGGENVDRALARAREMIDMEIALARDDL